VKKYRFYQALLKYRLLLRRKDKVLIFSVFILSLVIALFEMATAGVVALLAQAVLSPETAAGHLKKVLDFLRIDTVLSARQAFSVSVLGFCGIYLVKNVLGIFEIFFRRAIIMNIGIAARERILSSYSNMDYGLYLTRNSSFHESVVSSAGTALTGLLSVFSALSEFLIVVGLCSFATYSSPIVSVFVLVVAITFGIIQGKILAPYVTRVGERLLELGQRGSQALYEFFHAFKETLLLGKREYFIDVSQEYFEQSSRLGAISESVKEMPRFLVELLFVCVFGGVAYLANPEGVHSSSLASSLGGCFYVGFRLLPSFSRILTYLSTFEQFIPYVELVHEEFQKNIDDDFFTSCPQLTFDRSLSLTDISFQYLNTEREVLSNVCLEIRKGEILGFVGTTGSGKSTLVDIILGLLKPCRGDVLLDEKFSVSSPEWHRKIGYVPQSLYLIDGTIAENIAFGCAQADPTRLKEVILQAQLQGLVNTLPEKENTIVGERGIRLSGGERQRISIARALYIQPEVLIFDEATSSLDSPTEERIMKTIYEICAGRTVILVAHRVTTLKGCDRIAVMEKGRIKEIVSYKELMLQHA
jgi:ATP-binding cassette subfamily C protein